ncbi:beta-mannosidase [Lutzomyia longipalpis]|uniref:beta-mannosidase n=1 Tax=Lutzomyia longipalpis TaxID=7200 RepID=UPI00248373AB|nr:beta-mannosidase [Lutzomyia longipalpis]
MSCFWWSFGAMGSAASITILVLYFVVATSSSQLQLNSNWTLFNANSSIIIEEISLPSGVYTALQEAHHVDSVLYSYNDVNLRWIAMETWTYTLDFSVPKEIFNSEYIILTLHGVDTVAEVSFNGVMLQTSTGKDELDNMFTRYRFDVKRYAEDPFFEGRSYISITIKSPVAAAKALAQKHLITPPECPPNVYHGECHMNFLRKMQASFSWDWGPAVPSSGIWRPVVLEYYDSVLIRDITVRLEEDLKEKVWHVEVVVYMEAGTALNTVHGDLRVILADFPGTKKELNLNEKTDKNGELAIKTTLDVQSKDVELWWPNGYGRQKLYVLQAVFDPRGMSSFYPMNQEQVTKSVKIGFRTIEVVQEVMDDDPSKGLSFFFRVNGVPIFMKGTNWIPSSILPEKSFTPSRVKQLLSAVKTSHMNMIRVWGGGIYEDDRFYELTDTYGILIWHDLMFACAMYPVFPDFLASVREEVRQNVRRIQSHPSVAIWATNNENEVALVQNWYQTSHDRKRFEEEYRKLYIDVVKAEVEANDPWRECLSSSPSNGRNTEAEGWISKDPQDWHYGDIHYYNYDLDAWDNTIYPRPRFVSEYGFQSLPSLSSLDSILSSRDNMSQMIDHRQHSPLRNFPMGILIRRHLPLESITGDPRTVLEAFIYFSQVSQAMAIKTETEVYRANRIGPMNTMGALFWQLNDVWVAPSWSSIEFNGNYKILQHWVRQFMAPLHIIPLVDRAKNVRIYIVRDSLGVNQTLTVKLHLYNWGGFDVKLEKSWTLNMMENTAVLLDTVNFANIFGSQVMEKSGFIYFLIEDPAHRIISTNFIFPVKLRDAEGIQDPHIDVVIASTRCSFSVSQISLEVKARAPAIFVYLQIYNSEIPRYTLSKNGYIQLEPVQMIRLEFENDNCYTQLVKNDVRILTINDYLKTI